MEEESYLINSLGYLFFRENVFTYSRRAGLKREALINDGDEEGLNRHLNITNPRIFLLSVYSIFVAGGFIDLLGYLS